MYKLEPENQGRGYIRTPQVGQEATPSATPITKILVPHSLQWQFVISYEVGRGL